MTEPTKDGQVHEVIYGPGLRREYERTMPPAVAFQRAIGLLVSALKATGRDEAADKIWSRHLDAIEASEERIPDLDAIFGGLR